MNSIPKIIHYCWFGNALLPELAVKCIDSWRKYCPEYEIREWNENNFDLNACLYIKQAYERKKWAFVSDYARFKILYEHGGLYFDTDVELIKPIKDIVDKGPFMGCENTANIVRSTNLKSDKRNELGFGINPGLGLGALPKLDLYKEILETYNTQSFINNDGSENYETVVIRVTKILEKKGYKGIGEIEKLCGITIYPPEYFCPKDYRTGEVCLTKNTRAIHHFAGSWFSLKEQKWNQFTEKIRKRYGVKKGNRILKLFPLRLYGFLRKRSIKSILKYFIDYYKMIIKKSHR